MRAMEHFARKRRAVAVFAAFAAVAAGFGASATTAPAAGGGELVVGTMAPVGTPAVDFGGIFAGLKAGIAAANARGGINGKKIKVWTCNNSTFQAAQELACARKAVSEGVDVMVGDNNGLIGDQYGKILRDAGIPDVSNTGPFANGFQGSNTFPATLPIGTTMSCVTKAMAKLAGGKTTVLVTNSPGPVLDTLYPLFTTAAKRQGLTLRPKIVVAPTTADFAPLVARAQQSGADWVITAFFGVGVQAFIRAASAANAHFSICMPLGLSGTGGFYNLGSAANRTYVGVDFQTLNTKSPEMRRFRSEMAAQAKRGDKHASLSPKTFIAQTMQTWLGVQVVLQAAKSVKGDFTRSSMLRAIATHRKYTFGGIIPDFTFRTRPSSGVHSPAATVREYQRVWNSNAFLWKWNTSRNYFSQVARVPNTFNLIK